MSNTTDTKQQSNTPQPSPSGFTPAFTRIQQAENFDCAFACIAMLCNKTLSDIKEVASAKFKHPKYGPYWVNETLIASLLAQHKLVATVYKVVEAEPLPDVAILLVDYDAELELGRHVLFHRGVVSDSKGGTTSKEYVVDPAYWIPADQQVRTTWRSLKPAWYIGVHPMKA